YTRRETAAHREEPHPVAVHRRLQPDEREPGGEHQLGLGRGIPEPDDDRAAASLALRREVRLVISPRAGRASALLAPPVPGCPCPDRADPSRSALRPQNLT